MSASVTNCKFCMQHYFVFGWLWHTTIPYSKHTMLAHMGSGQWQISGLQEHYVFAWKRLLLYFSPDDILCIQCVCCIVFLDCMVGFSMEWFMFIEQCSRSAPSPLQYPWHWRDWVLCTPRNYWNRCVPVDQGTSISLLAHWKIDNMEYTVYLIIYSICNIIVGESETEMTGRSPMSAKACYCLVGSSWILKARG